MLVLFISCGTDNQLYNSKFCQLPALFSFSPVNSISQLYSSCENMGEWCTITTNGNQFLFTKPSGSQGQYNRTAITGYKSFYMGLSGFIIGKPNIPEVGEDYSTVTCFDLACRNCYDQRSVARSLVLQETGFAYCAYCKRTYNLNNIGQVSSGEEGLPLFRYRVYYGNNTLTINNR
jgi:hypothetical protein